VTIHFLNQFLWPDSAPTALYAEQLGLCFRRHKFQVVMVSGSGSYRSGSRERPPLEHIRLATYRGRRADALSNLREYQSVCAAFQRYIQASVQAGDIVFCTAAPPQTIRLIDVIRQKKARGIYRLEDYYPDLLRGFLRYPLFVRDLLARYWDAKLRQWDHVAKIASNLAYEGPNVRVLRNWATLDLGAPRPFEPKTACYFGNLGYGHSLRLFVETCGRLRDEGYAVTVVGDGPRISLLPSWIKVMAPVDEATLIELHWRAEIHLIAADPDMTGAIFPSKYWNSRATGRRIVASGFSGPMLKELDEVNALQVLPRPEDWLPLLGA
jgi:hypothetical protein